MFEVSESISKKTFGKKENKISKLKDNAPQYTAPIKTKNKVKPIDMRETEIKIKIKKKRNRKRELDRAKLNTRNPEPTKKTNEGNPEPTKGRAMPIPPIDSIEETTKEETSFISKVFKEFDDFITPKDNTETVKLKDYKDILEDHKNEIRVTQQLSSNKIDSHHLFFHPIIDKELALFYLRECNLSYQTQEDRAEEVGVDYIEEDSNYFKISIRIGYYGDRTIVSFRGTDNLSNIQADIYSRGWDNLKLSSLFDFVAPEDDLKVHSGFIQTIKEIYDLLNAKLEGRNNIEYTGHSYGSVCCIYAYLRLLETGQQPKSIYTFGSPRLFVNDPNYSIDRFNDRLDVIRFFNVFDGISYLPTKDSQSTGATALGLLGGFLGYSLGSLFSKKISQRLAVSGVGTGALAGRQVGNYIHIGTGIKLFDERGSKVRPEYSLHYKHKGGQLPPNENYIVIPKGIDVYRNILDTENFFTKAIYNILTTKFFNDLGVKYTNDFSKNRVDKVKTDIINSIDNLEVSDLQKHIVENINIGKPKTPRTNEGGLTEGASKIFYGRLIEATRRVAGLRFTDVRARQEGEYGFTNEGKIYDINYQLLNDGLIDSYKTEILSNKYMSIDFNKFAVDSGLNKDYLYPLLKNKSVREEWKRLQVKILTGNFISKDQPTRSFQNRIVNLLTVAYASYIAGVKVYADAKEAMKFGDYHKLRHYVKTINMLPEFISENKNNNHIIKANVSGKKTDDLFKRDEETTNQETIQQDKEGKSESNPSTKKEEDSKNVQDKERVKIGKAIKNEFYKSKREGAYIKLDDEAINYTTKVDNADKNAPISFEISSKGKQQLTKQSDSINKYITGETDIKPEFKEDSSIFYNDLLDEINEGNYSSRRRRGVINSNRRRRSIIPTKLKEIEEELKEKIENEINPIHELKQINNNNYLDEFNNRLYESRIISNQGNYDLSFTEKGIKILGYIPYKEDYEIENKIVIF